MESLQELIDSGVVNVTNVCNCTFVKEDGTEIAEEQKEKKCGCVLLANSDLAKTIVVNSSDSELLAFIKELSKQAESAELDYELWQYFGNLAREEM